MTSEEILQRAIEKAKINGWRNDGIDYIIWIEHINEIIFSHEFAKSFWGDKEVDSEKGRTLKQYWNENKRELLECGLTRDDLEMDWIKDIPVEEAWAYHLKQMVLEKEPLKYLEKFL